jgi:cytochrome c-type biogenesis protein
MLDFVFALLAGVATVASPCTLPVLPILLGVSVGPANGLRPLAIAIGFVTSFSCVALVLNLVTSFFDFDPNVLRSAAALLLVGFGLLMIWPALFEGIATRVGGVIIGNSYPIPSAAGIFGGFVLGMSLGLVWTPCAGPVLGSILTLVATSRELGWASFLLVTYAIGAAIPMLALAYGGTAVSSRLRAFARLSPKLQRAFGFLVVVFALASYFQYDTLMVSWLTSFYPEGGVGL